MTNQQPLETPATTRRAAAAQEQDPTKDNFFAAMENTKPYFKCAFEGFAGSGKTHTAAQLTIGLHKKIKSKKPVIIFDTERASKFLKPMFEKANIQVMVRESRSLADLKETMKRMREGAGDVLLIDSISHVWENFLEAYKRKTNHTFLQFQDWGIIKPTWKTEFSDPFVNDPTHIVMTGRAGYEYEQQLNETTNKKEIVKSGIKMKVEGETAYEPDILVLMERFEDVLSDKKVTYREATVIKDRSTLIDGKTFKNPSFKDFEPAIDAMLASPVKLRTDGERDAAALISTEEGKQQWVKEKKIVLEEIEAYLVSVWPSSSAAEKKLKGDALFHGFGTRSWTAVDSLGLAVLQEGYKKIQDFVALYIESQKPLDEEMPEEKGK